MWWEMYHWRRKHALGSGHDLTSIMCKICPNLFHQNIISCANQEWEKWMVNLGAVLGETSTGGGLTWLNSHTGIYGCPWYAQANVHRHWRVSRERNAHTSYTINAESRGKKARNNYEQLSPGNTQYNSIVDGSWSKWSNKHSYTPFTRTTYSHLNPHLNPHPNSVPFTRPSRKSSLVM